MTEQDVKQQILITAMTVFAQKGFAKASLNDIVRESGLSKGGVYWHFKSKDELLKAIFEQFFTTQTNILHTILTGSGPVSDRLRLLARQAGGGMDLMRENFPFSLEFYALAAHDDNLQQTLQMYFEAYQGQLAHLIQQGIDGGEFRSVSAAEVAHTLVSLLEGVVLLWAVFPTNENLAHQLETAVHLLLTGLQTPSPTK